MKQLKKAKAFQNGAPMTVVDLCECLDLIVDPMTYHGVISSSNVQNLRVRLVSAVQGIR